MISHPSHTLSHLECTRTYEFQFTGLSSRFVWRAGDAYVTEISDSHDVQFIAVSDVQSGSVEVNLKKVIKRVCRYKTEEENGTTDNNGNSL